jgi:hypothetical protein
MPVLLGAQAATTTTLAVTANGLSVSAVDAGAEVTLTATVETGGKAVALGQVNFCDATAKLCSDIHLLGTAQLSSAGKAAVKLVPRAGAHTFKAEFIGTTTDKASVSTDMPLVVYGVTKTTITQAGSAGSYTLKATVTGQANDIAPAGNVEFHDTSQGNAVQATATLGTGTSAVTWSNPQNPATEPQPLSIAVGDFNGDGIPDLMIGTNGTATGYLGMLLGNGNGTFQAAKNFAGLPNNQAMVVAPFINGGPLDVLTVSNNASGTNNAAMFIGDGKGGGALNAPFSLGGLAQVNGIAAGDFNRDGSEDYVITGIIYGVWCFAPVMGNGNGTFGSPTLNAIGDYPLAVAVGAFNTNGYPDIVVADSVAGQVTIFQNNSQGYFFPEGQANTGTSPIAMVTGDFNGDGYLDLAVVNKGSDNVNILFGHGNETLTAGTTVPVGHAPTSIAVGDFNGDGIADLAVVNSGDKTVTILRGKGDGTFVAGGTLATGINPVNLVTGDFAGAGLSALAVTNQDIASTTGSTLTVQAAQVTETATASATKVDPLGTGAHLVDASYGGDSLYNTSVSTTTSLNGTAAPAATPVLTPAAGTYASAQKVTLTDSTSGAAIYYTTNGITPTAASTKYTGAITVAATETIEAIAVATGFTNSAVASARYTIETPAAAPVFSPVAGTYTTAQSVKITSATTGATVYYTTTGATPTTASTKYTAGIAVSASETIKAIAVATGHTNSAVGTAAYVIAPLAATPVFSPAAGTYTTAQSVKITSATTGATVYYTTTGATPTTASTKYTAAIAVSASETIKAIAVATGHTNSAVAAAKYTIVPPAAKPTFSVASGTYSDTQSVQIADTTPGATIYYTTNGAAPTPASAVYKSAVSISVTGYLQAIAVANGYSTSPIASALYSIGSNVTATPVLSPVPGAYGKSQTVTMTDATPGAVITYSVGIGSVVNTYTYTAPFAVSSTEYIAYDAIAPGYTRSAALEGIYTIGTVPTPQFSPVAGSYSTAQTVNIYDITPGATIHYTTDGTTPTTASLVYTDPIIVTANQTLRALAAVSGLTSSAAVSSAYTIGKVVATPVFSLAPGSYTSAKSVAITDITPGATIYYTIGGATPTTASTKYTGAISVAATETLKAIAVATGYTNSAVASASYTIGYPIETIVVTASGTNVLTLPVGGSGAFSVASENQSGQSYPSVTVKSSTGANPSLPVEVTLCQTNPSTGQCLAAPGPTVTVAPFAAGATRTFSVFVTADAAIASSPNNEVVVLFTNSSGSTLGTASVLVDTN